MPAAITGTLSATQIVDPLCRGATLIDPAVVSAGILVVPGSASKYQRRRISAYKRNLRNSIVFGDVHARKVSHTAQSNRRSPAFRSDARALRDFLFICIWICNFQTIDISNARIIDTARNTAEALARLAQLGAVDCSVLDLKRRTRIAS